MKNIPLRYRYLFFWLIGILVTDQITKIAMTAKFQLGETLSIIPGFFNLTLVHNPGAAFGLFASAPEQFRQPFFFAVPLITLLIIFYLFHKLNPKQKISAHALSSIIAGAIGNLIDRFRFNYVVDFLDFHWRFEYHFPAFNVADSAISIGVALLLIASLVEKSHAPDSL
jgi:signal peptidase II